MLRLTAELPYQKIFFFAALVIYGVFGSPTPDHLAITEWIILILLFLSLEPRLPNMTAAESLLCVYGLTVPVVIALIQFHPVSEMIRDIVPFLFLLMPVMYDWRGLANAKYLSYGIAFIGFVFGLRSLWMFRSDIFSPDTWLGTPPDLLYLANSPEVLFAAIFFLGLGFGRNVHPGVRALCFTLALCPLLAMATLVQRASAFYLSFAALVSFSAYFIKNPKNGIILGGLLIIACLPFYHFIDEVFKQLTFKNQIVGLNSRGDEWRAVMEQILQSSSRFLFGIGWGGDFENPAVGGLRVNYTHSLLSALLLKTGLIGLMLFLFYIIHLIRISILKRPWRRISGDVFYLCALLGPLFIGMCLYASYKSLGYGLLILLLSSFAERKRLDETERAVP